MAALNVTLTIYKSFICLTLVHHIRFTRSFLSAYKKSANKTVSAACSVLISTTSAINSSVFDAFII